MVVLSFMIFATHRLFSNIKNRLQKSKNISALDKTDNRRILELLYEGMLYCGQAMTGTDDGLILESRQYTKIIFEFLTIKRLRKKNKSSKNMLKRKDDSG